MMRMTAGSVTRPSVILILCLLLPVTWCQRSFDGFSVIRLQPDTEQKLQFLKTVAFNFDNDVSLVNEVNFWKRPRNINETVDVMVSPSLLSNLQSLFHDNSLDSRILIHDLQPLIEREKSANSSDDLVFRTKSYLDDPNSFFQDYHRLNEIFDYMRELAAEYSNRVKILEIGKSYEGRNMSMWIITNNVKNRDAVDAKPIIWIDSGIHAREWISPATGLFIATQVLPPTTPCYTRASSSHSFPSLSFPLN